LLVDRRILPDDDDSTLFICSGMQRVKKRFHQPDGERHGSLQSCVRTDDIELVGDGSHLTYFEMLGNFSFGRDDYELSVDLWHSILSDLRIKNIEVHFHPSQDGHQKLWEDLGYSTRPDESCVWSDGVIGGFCCELFVGQLEIGNLVNPLGHSTDVGFGWERLLQVIEGKSRIDETTLFDQSLHPIVSDHSRTIAILKEHGIEPGNKGRNYVCRRLLRRVLRLEPNINQFSFRDWLISERELRDESIRRGRRVWKRHKNKPRQFWWETFGILPELIKKVEPSVVRIAVQGPLGRGIGSGFFIDDKGTLVTNYHVIRYASEAEVMFDDRTSAPIRGYLWVEPKKDLAVLQLGAITRKTQPLPIANVLPEKGAGVLAMGAPRGFSFTPSEGIVSAVRSGHELREIFMDTMGFDVFRLLGFETNSQWIQTTAPISPGNSGGPLVDKTGKLVGVNTWTRPDGQNLNFAISSLDVKIIADKSRSESLKPLSELTEKLNRQVFVQAPRPNSRPVNRAPQAKLPKRYSGSEEARFTDHSGRVNAVAVSHDGRYLATAGDDKYSHVLDAKKLESIHRFGPHKTSVTGAAFVRVSADTTVAVSTQKHTEKSPSVMFWSLEQKEKVYELPDSHIEARGLRIAPNQGRLAVTMGSIASRLYTISPFSRVGLEVSKTEPCRAVAFSPDSRYILSSSGAMVVIWVFDEKRRGPVRDIAKSSNSNVNCIEFSPTGDQVFTGHDDGIVRSWDFETGRPIAEYKGHQGAVKCIALSREASMFVTGGDDKSLRVWDAVTKQTLVELKGHIASISSVAIVPGSKRIASASADGTVRLWRLDDPNQVVANPPNNPRTNPIPSNPTTDDPSSNPFEPKTNRLPRPDKSLVAEARQLIKEIFEEEYRTAKTREAKSELADKLFAQAKDATTEHDRFALLSEAGMLSLQAPNPRSAMRAAWEIGERYDVDSIQMKLSTVKGLAIAVKTRADRLELVSNALVLADEASGQHRFTEASAATTVAKNAAVAARDATALAKVRKRETQAQEDQAAWDSYQKALKDLQSNPADNDAHLAVGMYACSQLGDWALGLQHLIESNHESIEAASSLDLNNPKAPDAMVAAADAWLKASQDFAGKQHKAFLSRAKHWYEKALPSLASLQKLKVQKNLQKVDEQLKK
jgi:S1-C subfamily serine protease